jgi:Rad3-related DNA helicase
VDDRYTWSSNRSQISKWLRDRVRVSNSCEEMADSLAKFFTEMKSRNFVPKVD